MNKYTYLEAESILKLASEKYLGNGFEFLGKWGNSPLSLSLEVWAPTLAVWEASKHLGMSGQLPETMALAALSATVLSVSRQAENRVGTAYSLSALALYNAAATCRWMADRTGELK